MNFTASFTVNAGAKKLECEILAHENISPVKKELADWYAKLLINNMLVTIRWWFSHSDLFTAEQVTHITFIFCDFLIPCQSHTTCCMALSCFYPFTLDFQ